VILTWLLAQALLERSQAKSEFLCHEQGSWGRWSEEARRTAAAEAWLAEAQQKMADLNRDMISISVMMSRSPMPRS
jgi:hypothetical protein